VLERLDDRARHALGGRLTVAVGRRAGMKANASDAERR
jgi:hypothetical protein